MKKYSYKNLPWKKRFSYIKNVLFDEESLHQKGAKFQIIRFLANTSIGPHYHKHVFDIFYVKKGVGTFIFNSKKIIGKKDDFFLCQPNDIHEIVNQSSQELIIFIFKTNEDSKDIFWINDEDKEKYG